MSTASIARAASTVHSLDEIKQAYKEQASKLESGNTANVNAGHDHAVSDVMDLLQEMQAISADMGSPVDPAKFNQLKEKFNKLMDKVTALIETMSPEDQADVAKFAAQAEAIADEHSKAIAGIKGGDVAAQIAAADQKADSAYKNLLQDNNLPDLTSQNPDLSSMLGSEGEGRTANIFAKMIVLFAKMFAGKSASLDLVGKVMSTNLDTSAKLRGIADRLQNITAGFKDANGVDIKDMKTLFELAYNTTPARADIKDALDKMQPDLKDIVYNDIGPDGKSKGHPELNGKNCWDMLTGGNGFTPLGFNEFVKNADGSDKIVDGNKVPNTIAKDVFNSMFEGFYVSKVGQLLNKCNNNENGIGAMPYIYPNTMKDGKPSDPYVPDTTKAPSISCTSQSIGDIVKKATDAITAANATSQTLNVKLQQGMSDVQQALQNMITVGSTYKETNTAASRAM